MTIIFTTISSFTLFISCILFGLIVVVIILIISTSHLICLKSILCHGINDLFIIIAMIVSSTWMKMIIICFVLLFKAI